MNAADAAYILGRPPPAGAAPAAPASAPRAPGPLDHLLTVAEGMTDEQLKPGAEHRERLLALAELMGADVVAGLEKEFYRRQIAAIGEAALSLENLSARIPSGAGMDTLPLLAVEAARLAPLYGAVVYHWNAALTAAAAAPSAAASTRLADQTARVSAAATGMLQVRSAQVDGLLALVNKLAVDHPNAELAAHARTVVAAAERPQRKRTIDVDARPSKRSAESDSDARPAKRARADGFL